jgi:hypothetical protein
MRGVLHADAHVQQPLSVQFGFNVLWSGFAGVHGRRVHCVRVGHAVGMDTVQCNMPGRHADAHGVLHSQRLYVGTGCNVRLVGKAGGVTGV